MTDNLIWDGERAPFAKAFVAAQMATEAVKKASTNPAFKSKYADLAGVVEAVVPALNKAGIGVIQSASNDGEMVGITTTLLHESGSSVTGTLRLRPSKTDPQGVGSAITYGRRYLLLAMTGAAPDDDDGQAASGPREVPQQRQPEKPAVPSLAERANRLESALRAKQGDADAVQKVWDSASALCADLDDKAPERLAELEALLKMLLATPEQVAA